MTAPLEAVFQVVPRPPKPDPFEPGPFAFANQDRVSQILTQAGFTAPSFEKFNPVVDVGAGKGVEGAVGTALEFGPTARVLADESEAVKDRVAGTLRTFFTSMEQAGSIKLPAAIWIVQAAAA